MNQTKLESLLEANINTFSAFLLSLIVWSWVVVPYKGFETSLYDNVEITGIFTVLSIARTYLWRRFFNAEIHKAIHRFVIRILR